MALTAITDSFRRLQAAKSRYPGHFDYGYTHGLGQKERRTNVETNEFLNTFRQKRATEWAPLTRPDHPKAMEIGCYSIHYLHVGQIPNYGGHIPGAKFRFGKTFGNDTIDAKRWLRGDYRV